MKAILSVALVILLTACSSCAGLFKPTSTVAQQYQATYSIQTVCDGGRIQWGTAFAISPRHLITARHVIKCPTGEPQAITAYQPRIKYHGSGGDPTAPWMPNSGVWRYDVTIDVVVDKLPEDENTDAARLVVAGASEPFRTYLPVATYRPHIGQEVCAIGMMSAAGVSSMKKCGYVAGVNEQYIFVSIRVVAGNSGGPLIDSDGNVIGTLDIGQNGSGDDWGAWASADSWWSELEPSWSPNMEGEWP